MAASSPSARPAPAAWSGRLARNWHRLFLTLGCAFVLLVLGSSHWQGSASLRALGELRQQAERVERLDSLLIQLMAAENAVRGYLLSGNRAHLEPYEKSLTTVNRTLAAIRRDLDPRPDNLLALADLAGLVAIKLRSLELAIERGTAGEETRIKGKRNTDGIRDGILGLKARLAADGDASFARSTGHVERMRRVIALLAGGALLLMLVLYVVLDRQFKLRGQLTGMLQSENQRLDALVRARTTELSDLASYLTNAREAEKAQLARELHDELGALLTAAKLETGAIARKLDAAAAPCRERLLRLDAFLESGIALQRRIIDGLRPALLEELGLISALRTLGDEFADEFANDSGSVLSLELPDADLELAPASALALFRIAQEALTNIRRHAHAKRVKLALRVLPGQLELAIEDDGVGFLSVAAPGRQHGLAGMRHRVQMCAGEFVLNSQPGAGTRIVARIPLPGAPLPPLSAAGREGAVSENGK